MALFRRTEVPLKETVNFPLVFAPYINYIRWSLYCPRRAAIVLALWITIFRNLIKVFGYVWKQAYL